MGLETLSISKTQTTKQNLFLLWGMYFVLFTSQTYQGLRFAIQDASPWQVSWEGCVSNLMVMGVRVVEVFSCLLALLYGLCFKEKRMEIKIQLRRLSQAPLVYRGEVRKTKQDSHHAYHRSLRITTFFSAFSIHMLYYKFHTKNFSKVI